MYEFVLPYPPSINHYFVRTRYGLAISRKGRVFRRDVGLALAGVKPLDGKLSVTIEAYPPDRRKRDIDNIQKPLLDALEKGGAFFDDSQIKQLSTKMLSPVKGGKTIVKITQI